MSKILKQAVGIDVAQNELVVSLARLYDDLTPEIYASGTFPNDGKGFKALTKWVKGLTDQATPIQFVFEATGVYHEKLSYYLDDHGCRISIVLPSKISSYFRTLQIKTVTDKSMSRVIAQFGLERKLDNWKRPKQILRNLRQVTRERSQIIEERTMLKNQLHAESSEADPNPGTLQRMKKRIATLDKQEKEVKAEISLLIKQDATLKEDVKMISTCVGVGELTAATVLAETNGFDLISSKKQVASYAGYDVVEKQSGTSVKGKPRISKRGNKNLRKAMHLPALTAIQHDERFRAVYERLIKRHGIKMKAVVAVQRKLLELIYTIYKSKKAYDKNYLSKQGEAKAIAL